AKNDFVLDFTVAKASIHESNFFDVLFESIKSFSKILLDAAYDSYDIFSKIMSSNSIPVIDLNKRNTKYYESYNRYVMKSFRIAFKNDYKLRWEIERVNGIMDMSFGTEYVWYVRNRNYLTFAGITVL
ncbi:transposase, partial [Marinitoga arctica]